MALTPSIQATKLTGLVVERGLTANIQATKLAGLTLINFRTQSIQANALASLTVNSTLGSIHVNALAGLVVCRGRNARPAISPWTFTIDGHEFLVINTYRETLVYDFHSERWAVYGSGEDPIWNVQVGQNWNANLGGIIGAIGGQKVSNVIVGDGTTSALYFLDPELDEDYSSLGDPSKSFMRVITGQLVSRSNDYTPLANVELNASDGRYVVASDMSVELTYSDDTGITYNSFGTKFVTVGDFTPTMQWRSCGSYRQPGRLLKLTDYGALRRVDDWTTP